MKPKPLGRGDLIRVADIIASTAAIREYTHGMTRAQFGASRMVRDAVEKRAQNVGEAAKGLSEAFKQAHPNVPWRMIMRMRDRVAHHYWDVDPDVLWSVAKTHARRLAVQLRRGPAGNRNQTPEGLEAAISALLAGRAKRAVKRRR